MGVPREKPLGAEERTNKLSPYVTPGLGIEPRTHWWKASALITAPTLLPEEMSVFTSALSLTVGPQFKIITIIIVMSGRQQINLV